MPYAYYILPNVLIFLDCSEISIIHIVKRDEKDTRSCQLLRCSFAQQKKTTKSTIKMFIYSFYDVFTIKPHWKIYVSYILISRIGIDLNKLYYGWVGWQGTGRLAKVQCRYFGATCWCVKGRQGRRASASERNTHQNFVFFFNLVLLYT